MTGFDVGYKTKGACRECMIISLINIIQNYSRKRRKLRTSSLGCLPLKMVAYYHRIRARKIGSTGGFARSLRSKTNRARPELPASWAVTG